jgi:hypothetical protein
MEVCRRPFDPFIYHGWSVNARLTLIGRARRSIGHIGRAARPTDNPGIKGFPPLENPNSTFKPPNFKHLQRDFNQ